VAAGRPAGAGAIELVLPASGGDFWVLATSAGCAPIAAPLLDVQRAPALAFAPGRALEVRVQLPDGQPAAGIAVDFLRDRLGPATARATSDELGRARLDPVQDRGVLHVDDVRFCNLELAVGPDDATATLRLDAGRSLQGTVEHADGSPAPFVAVTLRDPRGDLRPAERTVASDAEGRFRFAGLPEAGRIYVLFAQWIHEGETWSARAQATAGERPWRLQLVHEDPQIRPPDGGR
jgi:hypothetical protein